MKNQIALVLLCCAAVASGNPTRIIGGSSAVDGQYPYQVIIRQDSDILCGGSIINSRYILTAAHCVFQRNPDRLSVVVGTIKSDGEGGKVYQAEKLIKHKNFVSLNVFEVTDDIALIRVSNEISFSDKVQPVTLPTDNFEDYNATVIVTGYGRISNSGEKPTDLQQLESKLLPLKKCQIYFGQVTERQICTLTEMGEGVCSGDSGGPLVANGVQIGIVSFGRACAQGVPDVHTKVYSYLDWIDEHME